METLLKSQIELQGKLQEQISIFIAERCDRKRIEKVLRGQVKILKKKIGGMESDGGKLEETLSCQIELQRKLRRPYKAK